MRLSQRIKERFYGNPVQFKTTYIPSKNYTVVLYRKVSTNCNFNTGDIEIGNISDEWIIEYTTVDDEKIIRNIPKCWTM